MKTSLSSPNTPFTTERVCFPDSVEAISSLVHLPPDQVAVQAMLTLSALAGPRAGLVTAGGELQPVGQSFVSVAANAPEQFRLAELLISPVRQVQEELLEYSAQVPEELIDSLSARFATQPRLDDPRQPMPEEFNVEYQNAHALELAINSLSAVSKGHPSDIYEKYEFWHSMSDDDRQGFSGFDEFYYGRSNPHEKKMLKVNEARCLREPLLLIEAPTADSIRRGLRRVDRQSALVLDRDGFFLQEALRKPEGAEAKLLFGLTPNRSRGLGETTSLRGTLFSISSRSDLASSLSPEVPSFLRGMLFVDLRSDEPPKSTSRDDDPAKGYTRFRQAVRDIICLRRLGALGITEKLNDDDAARLSSSQANFQARLHEVEAPLRPYVSRLTHLPATFVWSLLKLSGSGKTQDVIPLAMYLAEKALSSHLEILRGIFTAKENSDLELRAREMEKKLAVLSPCRPRDLYRTYPIQRKDVHAPVIEYLVDSGRIEREGGVLKLTTSNEQSIATTEN